MFGPLDDYDGLFGEGVLEAEGFEVVKTFDAVKIDVVNLARMRDRLRARKIVCAELVDEIERGAGYFLFARGAQAADDSLGQRGFSGAKVSLQQHQDGRPELPGDFAALGDGFFRGAGDEFVARHFSSESGCAFSGTRFSLLGFSVGEFFTRTTGRAFGQEPDRLKSLCDNSIS